jgi:hypothetical protein
MKSIIKTTRGLIWNQGTQPNPGFTAPSPMTDQSPRELAAD